MSTCILAATTKEVSIVSGLLMEALALCLSRLKAYILFRSFKYLFHDSRAEFTHSCISLRGCMPTNASA